MGETNPTKAAPGTIRGDLGREWEEKAMMNIVHGSDSVLSAEREINLWFTWNENLTEINLILSQVFLFILSGLAKSLVK